MPGFKQEAVPPAAWVYAKVDLITELTTAGVNTALVTAVRLMGEEASTQWQVDLMSDNKVKPDNETLVEARRGLNSFVGMPVAQRVTVVKRFESVSDKSYTVSDLEKKVTKTRREKGNRIMVSINPYFIPVCLGVCITNGQMVKAWDFDVNPGAPVQIHVKAEEKEWPGQWYRAGVPIPEEEVPREVKELSAGSSTRQASSNQHIYDISRPATKILYEQWKKREVSPQKVVSVGGTGMLSFFHALADIPDEVWTEITARDTLTLEPPTGQPDPLSTNAASSTDPPNPDEQDTLLLPGQGMQPLPEAAATPIASTILQGSADEEIQGERQPTEIRETDKDVSSG